MTSAAQQRGRAGRPGVKTTLITDDFGKTLLYRRCSSCYSWRPQRIGEFSPRRRDPETRRVLQWDAYCAACRRAANREYRANLSDEKRQAISQARWAAVKADPDRLGERRARNAELMRQRRAENPEPIREQRRAHYRRAKADPAKHAAMLESRRIAHRLRRELREGVHVEDVGRKSTAIMAPRLEEQMLSAKPLGDAIRAVIDRAPSTVTDPVAATCTRAGITDRNLRAWVSGERRSVQAPVARRAVEAIGLDWWIVWAPDVDLDAYEAARAAFADDDEAVAA